MEPQQLFAEVIGRLWVIGKRTPSVAGDGVSPH